MRGWTLPRRRPSRSRKSRRQQQSSEASGAGRPGSSGGGDAGNWPVRAVCRPVLCGPLSVHADLAVRVPAGAGPARAQRLAPDHPGPPDDRLRHRHRQWHPGRAPRRTVGNRAGRARHTARRHAGRTAPRHLRVRAGSRRLPALSRLSGGAGIPGLPVGDLPVHDALHAGRAVAQSLRRAGGQRHRNARPVLHLPRPRLRVAAAGRRASSAPRHCGSPPSWACGERSGRCWTCSRCLVRVS